MLSLAAAASGYVLNAPAPIASRARAVSMDAAKMESAFAAATATPSGKQDFLEASPYSDQSNVPVNTYKNKAPHTGKVVSTKRIVGAQATGETCHIIIDHFGSSHFGPSGLCSNELLRKPLNPSP